MDASDLIKSLFPEFKDVDESVVNAWIAAVRPLVSAKKFNNQYEMAVALLACHKMKLNGLGKGIAGSSISPIDAQGLSSVSEGETSLSFNTSSDTDASSTSAEYKKTSYGLQFLSLRSKKIMTIAIGNDC